MSTRPVSPPDDASPLITVRTALQVPALRAGAPEVVAGHAFLDRPVRWVHAGEVPNMASLLKGGELLLTTGMGLGATAAQQRRWIADMARRGVSAIAVELGARFPSLPAPLISEADARDLPLIAIHREVRFVEITEALHREIVDHRMEVMRYGETVSARFTQLLLDGGDVTELLAELASTVANPIVLEHADRGVLYHALYRQSATAALHAYREAPARVEHVAVPVRGSGSETWGRLVALAVDTPLSESDRVALDRATGLIAVALLRSAQDATLKGRAAGDFLVRLLDGDRDESELRAEAGDLGFAPRAPRLLPIAVTRRDLAGAAAERAWGAVWDDVARELDGAGVAALAGTHHAEGELLVLAALAPDAPREALADRVAKLIAAAVARRLGDGEPVSIGVGPVAESWATVAAGLREAVEASVSGLQRPGAPWHDAQRADIDRLLWSLGRRDELRAFVDRRLGVLIEHDRKRSLQLVETLEAYFANGRSKARTARALHLERQSLYHRIERIERLIGEKLDDDATALGLQVALRARGAPGSAAHRPG